jgi:hypothetical protein
MPIQLHLVQWAVITIRLSDLIFQTNFKTLEQNFSYTFSTLPLLLVFTHPIRRSDNSSVRGKKAKREKNDKEKEKYASDLRGVKNSKYEIVQVDNSYLFHLFYSSMQGRMQ